MTCFNQMTPLTIWGNDTIVCLPAPFVYRHSYDPISRYESEISLVICGIIMDLLNHDSC